MTEWTPEEEAVARAMYERRHWGMKNVWSWDDSGLDDEHPGVRENILLDARAAISAMQPRWRDVKTDPPPRDGTPVLMAYAADGKAHLVAKYGVGAYSGDILWEWGWAMPPTHWQPITPPRPPAPETSRER